MINVTIDKLRLLPAGIDLLVSALGKCHSDPVGWYLDNRVVDLVVMADKKEDDN